MRSALLFHGGVAKVRAELPCAAQISVTYWNISHIIIVSLLIYKKKFFVFCFLTASVFCEGQFFFFLNNT